MARLLLLFSGFLLCAEATDAAPLCGSVPGTGHVMPALVTSEWSIFRTAAASGRSVDAGGCDARLPGSPDSEQLELRSGVDRPFQWAGADGVAAASAPAQRGRRYRPTRMDRGKAMTILLSGLGVAAGGMALAKAGMRNESDDRVKAGSSSSASAPGWLLSALAASVARSA